MKILKGREVVATLDDDSRRPIGRVSDERLAAMLKDAHKNGLEQFDRSASKDGAVFDSSRKIVVSKIPEQEFVASLHAAGYQVLVE